MNKTKCNVFKAASALLLLLLAVGPAAAEIQTWTIVLDGATAIPPSATSASGIATLVANDELAPEEGFLTLFAEYSGLSGPVTNVTFYNGSPTSNGTAISSVGTANPLEHIVLLNLFQAVPFNTALYAGTLYLVVATGSVGAEKADFPNGEIRGLAVLSDPVAEDAQSWGGIKAIYR